MDQIQIENEGENLVGVESNSDRIKTLAQLIRAAKIDLKAWEIERHVVNKWEVGAKDSNNNIVVEPLWQVKAWLVRKKPIPIMPVLAPVNLQVELPEIFAPSNLTGWRKLLYLPDAHFGFSRGMQSSGADFDRLNERAGLDSFHDREALDVALQIAQRGRFDEVIWGGDLLDLAEWSDRFVRSPDFYFTTQPAVIEAAHWMSKFRLAAPTARHRALEGNHDYRMRASLMSHLLMAYQLKPAHEAQMENVLSVPRLLGLGQMEIEWVEGYPDNWVWLSDYLCAEHGDAFSTAAGASAKKALEKGPVSRVFGHIHRREMVSSMVNDRQRERVITAACPGCLCRIDGAVPGHKRNQKWQQGVAVVHYNGQGQQVFELIPIERGTAMYQGRMYKARRDLISDELADALAGVNTEAGY